MDIKLLVRRFFAFVIDWNILFGGTMALMFFGPGADPQSFYNPTLEMFATLGFALSAVWFTFYLLFKDCLFGRRSLGKLIFRLRIVDSRTEQKASFARLILRNITFLIVEIEGLVVLINKGQRLGDVIAKTKVVSK